MFPPLPPSPFRPAPLAERILDLQCTIARVDAEIATFAGWAVVARDFHSRGLLTAEALAESLATWAKGAATSEMVAGRLRAELETARAELAESVAGQPAPVAEEGGANE